MEPNRKKGRLFGLINIVDLLVLLAVLAAVAGAVWYVVSPRLAGGDAKTTLTYTVRVRGLQGRMRGELEKQLEAQTPEGAQTKYRAPCIAGNDYVPDAYVIDVVFEPYVQQVPTDDGRLVDAIDPTRLDAIFTLVAVVPKNTAVIKVGPQEIRVGTGHYLKISTVEYGATIESMRFDG